MAMAGTLNSGMVFTNEKEEVIFASRDFYELIHLEQEQSLFGEPLFRILGLGDSSAVQFIRNVTQDGYIRDYVLEFFDHNGNKLRGTVTGRLAFDESGKRI